MQPLGRGRQGLNCGSDPSLRKGLGNVRDQQSRELCLALAVHMSRVLGEPVVLTRLCEVNVAEAVAPA